MSVVLNPYAQHRSQLGTIEAGLKTLKNESGLMSDSDFSAMYGAVEKHHRELRLAHLTGKTKDLMEQAEKDTKFYNILIKMLCEVKKLPRKQRKDTLRKVHLWYMGNRHTLASGPKFGKSHSRTDASPTPRDSNSKLKLKSGSIKTVKSSTGVTPRGSNKENQSIKDETLKEMRDDISSMRGFGDSMNPPSEPASSRMSMFGNDFLTNRFMMDLPSSKLSWHLDTPSAGGKYGIDGVSNSEWDGPELELQRIGESSLSHRTFDEHYHSSHHSVPNSSPQFNIGDDSPRSLASGHSSGADVCSTDMMEFHSDARRRISHRNQTSSGSVDQGAGSVQGVSEDQSSGYGLPRKMVHSIASLVNPHAKLAETEAIKQEQDYVRETTPFRASSKTSIHRGGPDLSAHIPVLRAVSVSSNKGDHIKTFNNFRQDHVYGQDILSRLNFVGRSGTALDVRYSAHTQADQPERHTNDVIQLYSLVAGDTPDPYVRQSESKIHNQTLEEFYQSADNYSPSPTHRFNSSIRTRSAPAPRAKSAKMSVNQREKTAQPAQRLTPRKSSTTQKLGKSLLDNKLDNDDDIKDEILYSNPDTNNQSVVKLETVVGMIDHVKDEMNYFREKLAPTPMSGFRQPASTSVSSKPLSRPTSTASRKSRPRSSQVRPRSPSPQGRPGTPQDMEDIMMGSPEVPSDTLKINIPLNRPHSATVNKAVDWRGKVTPEATKIKSKMRFGGHSYVQKLKPSLRTAGAVSSGMRPKTAPTSVRERWSTKDKECDRNERVVAQAASNTMTQVDDNDMDRIMNIQHILGSSDSRYGSMNSLFFDEEFLRSMNARYRQSSSMSQLTTTSQNKEYLSFSMPIGTPRKSPSDGRVSRQSSKKVNLIPEETNEKEDDNDNFVPALNLQEDFDETSVLLSSKRQELLDVTSPNIDKQENTDTQNIDYNDASKSDTINDTVNIISQTSEQNVEVPGDGKESSVTLQVNGDIVQGDQKEEPIEKIVQTVETRFDKVVETADKEAESVKEVDETTGDIFVEVTTVPSSGHTKQRQHLPTEKALQALSVSDTWHYQPEVDADGRVVIPASDTKLELNDKTLHSYHHEHHRHDLETQSQQEQWVKSIVKPENYCFQCLPDTMTTKVGRSAGRMPGGAQSPAGQVLRMARRQNEHYKKAPPVRTPPSIPSMHHTRKGITTPRQGQQYSTELEHHARKVQSPRHFMQQVVELRKDNCRSAPPGSNDDADDIMGSLSIVSLRTNSRAQTAPNLPYHKSQEMTSTLSPHAEHVDEDDDDDTTLTRTPTDVTPSKPTTTTLKTARQSSTMTTQSIAHIGRPIPQVSHVHDPDEIIEAVAIQREAKAAVDIQRIFRGYVCRNSYRKLIWENRKSLEDKQLAMQESQREYNKHKGRKAKIYNRPPLDPALLQWAKDFKSIQVQNLEKRQEKVDNMTKEMLAHQQKTKSKIEVIGPHVEIYDIYHPKGVGPSKRDMHKAAVCMQRHVRGFLVRKRFEKLRRKATFCGSTWEKLVKDYKNILIRVQRWHGIEKPVTPFTLPEMHEYMDMRRRYESQFDKKAFGGELELSELSSFFKECDLYPSAMEIEEGLDVTTNGQSLKKGNGLKKHEAINLLFYIYVPKATCLENTRQSTWMNPIINGIEAKKLIDSGVVESAPLKPCADLVINSRRDRKLKEEKERLKKLAAENDSDSDENVNKNNSVNDKTSGVTNKVKKGKKKI